MRYYVHGAGRGGRKAWPAQADVAATFADHASVGSTVEKVGAVVRQAPPGRPSVVAHSLGAVLVALAVQGGDLAPDRIVLVEPALFDLARGCDPVEAHIEAMTRARARRQQGDLFGYWQVVAPLMFGREATAEAWVDDEPLARRFAAVEPPWGHGVLPGWPGTVPVLVVTGEWNHEYEAVADRLRADGASHAHLPGFGHRPQDHPAFEALVQGFTDG